MEAADGPRRVGTSRARAAATGVLALVIMPGAALFHTQLKASFPAKDEVVTEAKSRDLALPLGAGTMVLITLDNGLDHNRPNTFGPKSLAALNTVGRETWAHHRPAPLSGGPRQRINLARARSVRPDLLLLDEPFSGVDVSAEQEIMETLDLLQAAQVTVIVATHDPAIIERYRRRHIGLADGKVVQP